MTRNQWRLLEIIEHHDRVGTMEVCIAWGVYDHGDTPAQVNKGWLTCRLVVAALVRTLVARGYATDDDDGYGITQAGIDRLHRRRAKAAS